MNELVSCLMVTGHDPVRRRFALAAIESFRQQTYPHRELVIINQSLERLLPEPEPTIQEIQVPVQPTLGDARNLSLDHARGDWWLPWDDDDWSHPDRITWQMGARDGQRAVVPCRFLVYSFPRNVACVQVHPWCSGLMLFPRCTQRYPAMPSSEDWVFMESFPNRLRWENPPEMYIRTHHGANTWGVDHILGRRRQARNEWTVPPVLRGYLKSILGKHYAWATIGGS